jgi:hypothetical protein
MAYRDPSSVREPTDPQLAAVAELGRRVTRTRIVILVPTVLGGIALGGLMYVVLRDWQFAHRGAHSPWITAVLSLVPTFGASLVLAPKIAQAVLRVLFPRWLSSLARAHELDEAELEETTRFLV